MIHYRNCLILLIFQSIEFSFGAAESSKRLLLHSDTDLATRILTLESQLATLESKFQTQSSNGNAGATYTRWGRTTCPGNGSALVYSGYMSGTFLPAHHTGGAGANYVCLPDTPTWDYYTANKDNDILVTGVEYNFNPHRSAASQNPFFGTSVGFSEAPCAVCHVTRGTSLMIPGRTDCYGGWTKEYSGYLVAGYPGYGDATEYVCLDRRPEVVPHSGNGVAENSLYFVEAHCGGTLSCPPYADGREFACVVCSI